MTQQISQFSAVLGMLALALAPFLQSGPTAFSASCDQSTLFTASEFPEPDAKPAAQTERQQKIVKALEKGIQHLRATQTPQGTWSQGNVHPVGYAAMPALAMLEVGVPTTDPAIERAAQFVRANGPRLDETYEIALAILFLNRLGDARDVPLIRSLAFRLIAGQCPGGGWSYRCPILSNVDEQMLLTFLNRGQPTFANANNLVAHPFLRPLPKGLETLVDPLIKKEKEALLNPTTKPIDGPKTTLPDLIPKEYDPKKKPETPGYDPNKSSESAPKYEPETGKPAGDKEPKDPKAKDPPKQPADPFKLKPKQDVKDPFKLKPAKDDNKDPFKLKSAVKKDQATAEAIYQWPTVPPFVKQMMIGAKGNLLTAGPKMPEDNSNTQFAILGLWAARKHGVPMALTLVRLDQRFRTSQMADGSWGYHLPSFGADPKKAKHQMGTPSMTCVGLMGLGVSHGAFQEAVLAQKKNPAPPDYLFDPAIQKGLSALSKAVDPRINFEGARVNLYYFWSVERTMVMFHLPTLGGVDWHAWGTDVILSRQTERGSWNEHGYPGSSEPIDTSMALLFLSRANLNRDLSESLRRYLVVIDPARVKAP